MIGTYTWDNRNRLEKVETPTQTITYVYDLFDRRIEKKVGATSQRFGYDGDSIVLEMNVSNNDTHRYLHGPQVDQILADENVGGTMYWPLTDHLGTVRDLYDSSGNNKNHIKYDTYGKRVAESDANFQTLYAFTGRECDVEVEPHFGRTRRFSQRFPVDPPQRRFSGEKHMLAGAKASLDDTFLHPLFADEGDGVTCLFKATGHLDAGVDRDAPQPRCESTPTFCVVVTEKQASHVRRSLSSRIAQMADRVFQLRVVAATPKFFSTTSLG